MHLPLVIYAIATVGAFATSSVASIQGGSTWLCPVLEKVCRECQWTCQHGPKGFAQSRNSAEFKDCLAKYCDVGEEGLDDCYRLDQATACVRQRCPPGPHFDYLDVSCNWQECRCA